MRIFFVMACLLTFFVLALPLWGDETFATPNDLFKRGAPTFVAGTLGNDLQDRAVTAQIDFIRGMIFQGSPVVADETIDVARGPGAWPRNPILYGGPHVNRVLAALAPTLPFTMKEGKLELGDQVFEGDAFQLTAVVPARAPDEEGPGYPEFLLYAGTGMPGIANANGVHHGGEPLLVVDTFGRYLTGTWKRDKNGVVIPHCPDPPAPRIEWRKTVKKLESAGDGKAATVIIHFPSMLPANDYESQLSDACMRGLERCVTKLEIDDPVDVNIYFYPDRKSKASMTGSRGDGQAHVGFRCMHLIPFNPAVGGPLEGLVMHEGAHLLSYAPWGAPGSALLGEGLAVWVADGYGGKKLSEWKRLYHQETPSTASLMTNEFFKQAERETYPMAGIFMEILVETLGLERTRKHLYGATALDWEKACKAAGTSPQALDKAFYQALGHE